MQSTFALIHDMVIGATINIPFWAWLFSIMGLSLPIVGAALTGAVIAGICGTYIREYNKPLNRCQIIPFPQR